MLTTTPCRGVQASNVVGMFGRRSDFHPSHLAGRPTAPSRPFQRPVSTALMSNFWLNTATSAQLTAHIPVVPHGLPPELDELLDEVYDDRPCIHDGGHTQNGGLRFLRESMQPGCLGGDE